MGKLIYLVCLSNLINSASWLDNFEQAQEHARLNSRPILMVFAGSDWCKPCIRLKQSLWESSDFQQLADSQLVLLYLDFPRYKKNRLPDNVQRHHAALATRYNPKGYFPHILLLNAEGEVLKSLTAQASQRSTFFPTLRTAISEYHAQLSD